MKKILSYSFIIILLAVCGCEKGLDKLNVNKTAATSLDPVLLMNTAILNTSFTTRTLIYDLGIVQQIITPNGGVLAGANFNQDSRDPAQPSLWTVYYQNIIKNTQLVLAATKEVPARSNMYNMARIYQAYAFMILTDEYGDIPFNEGGSGYTAQLFFPKYDKQQDIYTKIIQELTDAGTSLNTTGTIESADLLYGGDVVKWKKFANSLLLRAGMRLSKIDPAKAQTTVQAAANNGVIVSNADNAYMRHDANYTQPIGNALNGAEAANFYLAKPFVDELKSTADPRLTSFAIRYVGASNGGGQTVASGNITTAMQNGMPMGKDNNTVIAQATADGLASFYEYSQADRRRILKTNAPVFFVTASQTLLLLAEARQRGWITTNTTATYFADGIKAHMDQLVTYDANCAVSAAARDAYLATNPLIAGNELKQINTQYWISSFLNGPEAFANFRRSGFPVLTPNPYGQPNNPDVPSGTFIRRITYPSSEISINSENVNAAIARMGPDKLSTRVWWDKQ
jgi:Starch-binding associating with outer membrane